VGWWKLDEGSGSAAGDSTIPANNGTLSGDYEWVSGHDDSNSAVKFRNGKVLVADAAELRPPTAVSVCAWVYYSESQGHSARIVVKGADNWETYGLEIDGSDEMVWYVRDVNGNRFDVNGVIWHNEWIHLTGTFGANTVQGYINGELVDERDDANFVMQGKTLSQDTNDLGIGNRSDANDREFEGTIDDARVYNYVLSAAEVAYIATDGDGYVPLRSEVNIHDREPKGEKSVDFKDFDVLLDSWLEEKLWPLIE
jgi:hypothetical protein